MNDIKFKVYDNLDNKIKDIFSINFNEGNISGIILKEDNQASTVERTDISNITLLRYTGFKDMKGEEIFENYLVKFKNDEKKSLVGKVVFLRNRGCWCFQTSNTKFYQMYRFKYNASIIGNIYDNPTSF